MPRRGMLRRLQPRSHRERRKFTVYNMHHWYIGNSLSVIIICVSVNNIMLKLRSWTQLCFMQIGTGITNVLINIRKAFDKDFASEAEDVPVLSTSVAYGVYMAVSSNLRYVFIITSVEHFMSLISDTPEQQFSNWLLKTQGLLYMHLHLKLSNDLVSLRNRYQILAGIIEQRMLEPLLHNRKLALSAMCFAVRTGNTFLGSLMWGLARFFQKHIP